MCHKGPDGHCLGPFVYSWFFRNNKISGTELPAKNIQLQWAGYERNEGARRNLEGMVYS
jgi:hypothetical protein